MHGSNDTNYKAKPHSAATDTEIVKLTESTGKVSQILSKFVVSPATICSF